MIIAFGIWSIVALIFLGIGVLCRKSQEAVGFFTFEKPPVVKAVRKYNCAVSGIWIVFAIIFELLGVPFLFLEQNSPIIFLSVFGVVGLIIGIIIAYIRVEDKYKA